MKTIEYTYARLTFINEHIEPLGWDDVIRINCRDGTFEMTKRQFYDTFSNVVATYSYRKAGNYNYKKTPEKAMRYRENSKQD